MTGSGPGPGPGSGSRYLDPHRVYELVIRRMPRELLDYLDSIPGASRDLHCQGVKLVGKALLHLVSQPLRPLSAEENRDIACWARLARFHATNSRFCAPQMVGNPSNLTSDAGPHMHPHNSSSYSGRMLTHAPDNIVHRHAALHNPLSASSSKIPDAMLPPVKAKPMIIFPTRRAGMRDETSASNSGTHASKYVPSRSNSMIESISPKTRQKDKGGMGSSSARRFCTSGAVSRHGGAPPPRKAPKPIGTSTPSPASAKRGGGAPQSCRTPRPAPTSPSSPPLTSPPHRSLTSPRRPCCRARHPLRLCQRRILTQPSEANTAPAVTRQSLRLATASARGSLGSWSFRQTIEKVRVIYNDDDGGAKRKEIIRSWSDDDSDD